MFQVKVNMCALCRSTESLACEYSTNISYVTVNVSSWFWIIIPMGQRGRHVTKMMEMLCHQVALWVHCPPEIHHFSIDGTQKAWHMSICHKLSFIHHSGVPSPKKHFDSLETTLKIQRTELCQQGLDTILDIVILYCSFKCSSIYLALL